MSYPLMHNRTDGRITENDFADTLCRRIPVEHRLHIGRQQVFNLWQAVDESYGYGSRFLFAAALFTVFKTQAVDDLLI